MENFRFANYPDGGATVPPGAQTTLLDPVTKQLVDANSSPAQGADLYIANFRAANYLKSRAAMSKLRTGVKNMRALFIGDSTETGRAAATTGTYIGAYPFSPAARMAALLTGLVPNLVARSCVWIGTGGTYGNSSLYDTRVVSNAGWSNFAAGACQGNGPNVNNSTTNTQVFTPGYNIDSCEICYLDVGVGQWSVSINGAGTVNTTNTNTNTIKKVTITATTPGPNITVTRTSGAIYIASVHGWDSTIFELSIYPAGWSGGKLNNFVDDVFTYSPYKHVAQMVPDITFIRPGINDWGGGTTLASFQANLVAAVAMGKATGDVVFETSFPSQIVSASLAVQSQFNNLIYQVASANGVAVIDHWAGLGSYEVCGPLGFMDSDGIHGLKAGYDSISARRAAFFRFLM